MSLFKCHRLFFCALLTAGLGCSTTKEPVPIEKAPESFHEVLQRLRDSDFNVRMAAAKELGFQGPKAAPAVPYLVEALSDDAVKVRVWSALALGEIGPKAEAALPELQKATTREYNEWKDARESAARAIQLITGK